MRFFIKYKLYLIQVLALVTLYKFTILPNLSYFADDPGVGWHLETGKYIFNTHKVPYNDPFLSSDTTRTWISDQWLSDLFLYTFYEIGGFPLLYAICISAQLYIFIGIIFPRLIEEKHSSIVALLTLLVIAKLSSIHFILRPVVFSFVFFTLTHYRLDRWHKNNFDNKSVWILPIIFLLWSNFHPSFILGLTLLALSTISIIIDKFFNSQNIDSTKTYSSIFLLIACSLATLINPYFFDLHKSILFLSASDYFMNLHSEWLPIDIRNPEGTIFYTLFCIIMLLLYLLRKSNINSKTYTVLSMVILSYACIKSIRMAPYCAITTILVLADLVSTFIKTNVENIKSKFTYLFRERTSSNLIQTDFKSWPLPTLATVLLIIFATLDRSIPLYKSNLGPSQEKFPYNAISVLLKEHQDYPLKLLSHPNWGGFITFLSDSRIKPIIDDRNTLIGEDFHRTIMQALRSPQEAIDYASANNIKFVLFPSSDLKDKSKLNIIYEDPVGTLIKVE